LWQSNFNRVNMMSTIPSQHGQPPLMAENALLPLRLRSAGFHIGFQSIHPSTRARLSAVSG